MRDGRFFALINRLKYISRWGLMRNTAPENVCEHSMQVAVLAHALAIIGKNVFGRDIDPNEIAAAALFHDGAEIFTGDMPTPVKYVNAELKNAYKEVERSAKERLSSSLPGELAGDYRPLLFMEEERPGLYAYVKAADKLSAYIKCLEELKSGNGEFKSAEEGLRRVLDSLGESLPEVGYFIERILPGYSMTLDEL